MTRVVGVRANSSHTNAKLADMALLHLFSMYHSPLSGRGIAGGEFQFCVWKIGPKTVYLCNKSPLWDSYTVLTTHLNNSLFGLVKHSVQISAHCRCWDSSHEPEGRVQSGDWSLILQHDHSTVWMMPRFTSQNYIKYWTVLDHWTFGLNLIWILWLKQCHS